MRERPVTFDPAAPPSRVRRALARLDASARRVALALATDRRVQWSVFAALLALRCVALGQMVQMSGNRDGMSDESSLYLRHVQSAATEGLANRYYQMAQVMWHAPLSYLFWMGTLSATNPTVHAGRVVALAIYGASALVWIFLVRLLFARGQRVLSAAVFWIAPTWHTIEVRAYGLFLLLVLTTTYLALVPLVARDVWTKLLALAGLAASMVLLPANHLYGFLGVGLIGIAGVGFVSCGRRIGAGYLLCTLIAIAASIPWMQKLDHDRRRLQPRVAAAMAEAKAAGPELDPENTAQHWNAHQFSPSDVVGGQLLADLRINLVMATFAALAWALWVRRGASYVVWALVAVVLSVSLRATLPQVAALTWMARKGRAWRTWGAPWFVILLLGCFPALLRFPMFYANYLTGYRVLPFLLFADLLREPRWDWPGRIALFHVVGMALGLAHWMTSHADGWMPL